MKKIYFALFAFANLYAYSQCTPRALPFTENFSGTPLAACTPTTGGWVGTSANSGADWWIPSPSTNYAGGSAPEVEAYGNQANGGVSETIMLTSPPIDASATSTYTVSFKQSLYLTNSGASGSGIITLKVETSPNGSTWTQEWSNTYVATSSLTQVLLETRTFTSSNVSGNVYLRFSISGVLFKVWGWEIDDVNVSGTTGTTGIHNFSGSALQASPNPFSDAVNIACEPGAKITLIDVMGKVVREQVASAKEMNIDTKELPAGLYVVRTESVSGIAAKKIIKN